MEANSAQRFHLFIKAVWPEGIQGKKDGRRQHALRVATPEMATRLFQE
jgi:hypothetical protein